MVKKLIVLGIDGMDLDVVKRYKDHLPNLTAMLKENGDPTLRSVFPADTTPAWATIYTGKDPSEHGIINFVNVGAKDNGYNPFEFDDSVFKGETFWDKLNEQGYSCAVLLPMNIKVGYDINGLMITRPYDNKMHIYPKSKEEVYKPRLDILGTEAKFTSEDALPKLREEFFNKVNEEMRLTRLAVENEDVDVLFSYFSTTDGIQHDFWRHGNPDHPNYPGENEFENTIRDMYVTMDNFIGEMIEKCPEAKILVMSDHGHGARPVYTAKINELLRRGGYLAPKEKNTASKPSFKKKVKKAVKGFCVGFVKKVGLPKWAMKLLKRIPIWKGLFASSADFDWDKTKAYLSDLSALKNYSYGGIRLNDIVEDKDALADEIIEYLKPIKIEGEDKNLFEWIVRTNTFYHGEHLDRYPEIIYQMDERFGGEWELGNEIFGKSGVMHAFSPGGHRWRTAVVATKGIPLDKKDYEMTDICPMIIRQTVGE